MGKSLLKVLSSIAFTVSAIFTIQLMLGNTIGLINSILIVLMSVIFEFSKCFFLYKSIEPQQNINMIIRGISLIITIFLFCVSVLASLSFLQNETNKNKNKAILKSDSYKQQLQAKEQLGDLYNTKKAQISSLQDSNNRQIKALEQQRDNMPSNYLTRKADINKQISTLQENNNKQIADVNVALDTIASKQSQTINTKDIAINSEKGYTAFLQVVAGYVSNEDKQYTIEELEVILFSLISIVFELVAVLLFHYNKLEDVAGAKFDNNISNNNKSAYGGTKHIHNITPIKKTSNEIGFKYNEPQNEPQQQNEFTQEDLKKYVEYMNKTQIQGISKGYKTIAKNINITPNIASNIKGYLEYSGIVKTVGNKTIIV